MNGLETVVTLGAVVFAGSVLAPRVRMATPLLLLLFGLALGFLPQLRGIELHPETVLLVFLPVMLFWESLTTSLRSIKRDFRGIMIMSTSQRSQHVLQVSERIRSRTARPLLMALTGTPLINDIDDFRAIWHFLGWIDDNKPLGELMTALEETGLTPADPGFYAAARRCVIDLGIVRRRKLDVAADIPARRIADLPVELDGAAGRSIRGAEQVLARRMVARYETALASRSSDGVVEGIDHDLVRRVARSELKDATTTTGERVRHDAAHRPGEGRPRRRLRGAAGPQRGQGGVLRQARGRDGRGRGDLRPTGRSLLVDPR
jgi:hypothetical protein